MCVPAYRPAPIPQERLNHRKGTETEGERLGWEGELVSHSGAGGTNESLEWDGDWRDTWVRRELVRPGHSFPQ